MKDIIVLLDNIIFAVLMCIVIMVLTALALVFDLWFCYLLSVIALAFILIKLRR